MAASTDGRHRELRQGPQERVLVPAQLRNAVREPQEQRQDDQNQGEADPLPPRLAGDRGAQGRRQRLNPGVRDHPAPAGGEKLVRVLEGDRTDVGQFAHPLVEFAGPGDGLGAEQKLAAARPGLHSNESDLGVRDHPARRAGVTGLLDRFGIGLRIRGRQGYSAEDFVQGHRRRPARLLPSCRRHLAQVERLQGSRVQRNQAIELLSRRIRKVVLRQERGHRVGGIEKRLQRGARCGSVGWLEGMLLRFGDRERRDQE